ncbi:MAG: D-alanyl-D-alanine carboxypeptidase [Bacteroidales bacterium]|nr:D-alanyl-D-alanine carboxypeptidase [Bacteroidales bacterium]MDD4603517.1 D-alanyl-D-alanine carboxypeptidase [Bacteroidales bacterium]
MHWKRLIFLFLFLFPIPYSCKQDPSGSAPKKKLSVQSKNVKKTNYLPLEQALKTLRNDPLMANASIGYLIIDVTTKDPKVVADYHAKQSMIPASTLKIFVTGAALDIFGKEIIPEVTITNQMSINWRSSKLLRKIGGKVYHDATTAAGVKAITQYWSDKGVDTNGIYFYDGNGLSRNNSISPKQLVDALYVMRISPYFKAFYESLPLAGMTGTLHKAMKGTEAQGRIRAKTGTISQVKSFAGFVDSVTGRKLIFALIVNNFDCRVKLMKKKMELVLVEMARV